MVAELTDSFQRNLNYLRISVTDRCNLRCKYCMPPEGVKFKPHSQILRYEEIYRIVEAGTRVGITKVRMTGGEPLVRKGIGDLIKMLSGLEEIKDLSMTTNGVLLAQKAEKLKKAGLDRVNISLDTLNPEKFEEITRKDRFYKVIEGIKTARKVGFDPVKINVVVINNFNENEVEDFVEMAQKYNLHVRFIEYMPFIDEGEEKVEYWSSVDKTVSLESVREQIQLKFDLEKTRIKGNGPARYFKFKGSSSKGTVGFIGPFSHKFCADCNRLRLTADGKLKPCLAHDLEIPLGSKSQNIGRTEEIIDKFKEAARKKPASHQLQKHRSYNRDMFEIGG